MLAKCCCQGSSRNCRKSQLISVGDFKSVGPVNLGTGARSEETHLRDRNPVRCLASTKLLNSKALNTSGKSVVGRLEDCRASTRPAATTQNLRNHNSFYRPGRAGKLLATGDYASRSPFNLKTERIAAHALLALAEALHRGSSRAALLALL